MREIIAYTLIAFLVLFATLLLVVWRRNRHRVHQSIWGKPRSAIRRKCPVQVDENGHD